MGRLRRNKILVFALAGVIGTALGGVGTATALNPAAGPAHAKVASSQSGRADAAIEQRLAAGTPYQIDGEGLSTRTFAAGTPYNVYGGGLSTHVLAVGTPYN